MSLIEAESPSSCRLAVPPLRSLLARDTIRLIPTGRLKAPVLAPLAAGARALEDLAALEGVTNARLQASSTGLPGLDPRELAFGRTNDSFINAAFTHVRPGGNRFNDERRGAWYCAFEVETSLGEVAFHLTRELDAIGRYQNQTDYAEMIADFVGPFHDLTGFGMALPSLAPEIASAYPAGQALARRLREPDADHPDSAGPGSNGLVYPSVRCPGGTCLVAFRPGLVQNLRQGGIWRLRWTGGRTPSISRPAERPAETVCA